MRFFAFTAIIALATALPVAPINGDSQDSTKTLATRTISDVSSSLAAPRAPDSIAAADLEAREVVYYTKSFSWPSSSLVDGNLAYSFKVAKDASGDTYTFSFWNTQAPNAGVTYKYTATTTTGSTKSIELGSSSSGSFTLAESGTGFTVVISA